MVPVQGMAPMGDMDEMHEDMDDMDEMHDDMDDMDEDEDMDGDDG